jgi:hypothetical protein
MKKNWFHDMKQKIMRVGPHSLGVVVPAPFSHALGLQAGDAVEVRTYTETGRVSLQFTGPQQLLLPKANSKKL